MLHIISQPTDGFEKLYLQVRQKEKRVYDIEQIKDLPIVAKSDCHLAEWKVRNTSLKVFLNYLEEREDVQRILEIGCGNGWFSAAVAKAFPELQVVGCDMNLHELRQAEKAFDYDNLNFLHADIFEDWPKDWSNYDLVILPSSVQYFADLEQLFKRLWENTPEIHIMDSPFYRESEVRGAEQRSQRYYHNLGFPKMARVYHHHTYEELRAFDPQFLYRPPRGWRRRFARSPFPWVRLLKPDA